MQTRSHYELMSEIWNRSTAFLVSVNIELQQKE
jgi:hypothetical protein